MTGSAGGAGTTVGVVAGVGGGINTGAISLCFTAGSDVVVDVSLSDTAGVPTALSVALDSSAGSGADVEVVGCAGRSRTSKSLAPSRLSFQGKLSPGSPNA